MVVLLVVLTVLDASRWIWPSSGGRKLRRKPGLVREPSALFPP